MITFVKSTKVIRYTTAIRLFHLVPQMQVSKVLRTLYVPKGVVLWLILAYSQTFKSVHTNCFSLLLAVKVLYMCFCGFRFTGTIVVGLHRRLTWWHYRGFLLRWALACVSPSMALLQLLHHSLYSLLPPAGQNKTVHSGIAGIHIRFPVLPLQYH